MVRPRSGNQFERPLRLFKLSDETCARGMRGYPAIRTASLHAASGINAAKTPLCEFLDELSG